MNVIIGGVLVFGVVCTLIVLSAICVCSNDKDRELEDIEQLAYIRNFNNKRRKRK